jgi:hypothetical protein
MTPFAAPSRRFGRRTLTTLLPIAALLATTSLAGSAFAWDGTDGYLTYDGGAQLVYPNDMTDPAGPVSNNGGGYAGPLNGPLVNNGGSTVVQSFQGLSQYDTRNLNSGYSFIPPDTMGAVGATQFMETTNGGYAIYNKSNGALVSAMSDASFWAAAGIVQPEVAPGVRLANGDARVLFDSTSQKWIVESFAPNISSIQIAVSNDSDATHGFKSTQFVGYTTAGGGIADYPTLAIDSAAIYIGTNDFKASTGAFKGTTLNVISRDDIFGAGGPQVTSLKQFFNSYPASYAISDHGYAIQGVNQVNGTDTGKIEAIGLLNYGNVRYDVSNPGTAGATEGPVTLVSPLAAYDSNSPARQPSLLNPRVIDTLDDRLSSAVYEYNGMIFSVHTITRPGTDHTEIQYQVVDAATNALISTGYIGQKTGDTYDYYQGSIAVNSKGQIVIGYNRSGFAADGDISVFAQAFTVHSNGTLGTLGGPDLLVVSPTNDYHNGSLDGQAASGRQRWGDYSQVTVDPNDPANFWVIGEFAREPNDFVNGHPGGTGGTRWGTWISEITVAVPEPGTWALMLTGFGLVGGAMRRRAKVAAAA